MTIKGKEMSTVLLKLKAFIYSRYLEWHPLQPDAVVMSAGFKSSKLDKFLAADNVSSASLFDRSLKLSNSSSLILPTR